MLRHWLRIRPSLAPAHNQITIPKHRYFKGYSYLIFWALPAAVLLMLSSDGYFKEVIPNLETMKRDRERLVTRRRCFESLVMAHEGGSLVQKCNQKSLF